jgi:hypothetical protein
MSGFPNGIDYLQRPKNNGSEYSKDPMQLEQYRGVIRVWGVGEGHDHNDEAQGPGCPESTFLAVVQSQIPLFGTSLWLHGIVVLLQNARMESNVFADSIAQGLMKIGHRAASHATSPAQSCQQASQPA